MIRGIFITGTDTGVGKTYIASALAATLRKRGINVGVMKPTETGCVRRNRKLAGADAEKLVRAANVQDSLSLVNPYCFKKPLAPYVASELEGGKINPNKILTSFRTLSERHDFMIVEGAGGIMVPLSKKYLYLDLAVDLGLPVVIVSRPGLGTINHTLMTISVLKERGAKIAGVVLNYAKNWKKGFAERTNPGLIEALSGVKILGIIGNKSKKFEELAGTLIKPPAS